MNDIITADNLPPIIAAICTGIAAIIASKVGGKLGDEAQHLNVEKKTIVGSFLSNVEAREMADALRRIADILESMVSDTRLHRASKTEETLEMQKEALKELLERTRVLVEKERR